MRKYIFIILMCVFSTNLLQAKADIYLATGVLTPESDTKEEMIDLEEDLKASNPKVYESQEFKSAYNTSSDLWDFIESGSQLFAQNGWSMYWDSFIDLTDKALTQHYRNYFANVSKNHGIDLSEQIINFNTKSRQINI